ncbi:GNAT family N-acetyltransferase [Nguyenibacter sp. L1]|uniref:GNAT family N-acetyltransferase n=1 Tax=Nguyenibacter sp. L1 TaxID=3049350 RepID=UPI002B49D696|nr:GNAT family N-acetyltransferase [Nguyenibacter sp. L1]WRH88212.1 GNAT family N-acetyltransferase [Nguyenibacter sp. L1]
MTPHIRLARPGDLANVEAVVKAAYGHYVARLGRAPGPMLADYRTLIAARRVHVFLQDAMIAGCVVLIPEDDAMLLDNIAVLPSMQGRGIGRALVRFAERTASDQGYGRIRLYTNAAMSENLQLYARLGYRETHRAEEGGFRRVFMDKQVGAPS